MDSTPWSTRSGYPVRALPLPSAAQQPSVPAHSTYRPQSYTDTIGSNRPAAIASTLPSRAFFSNETPGTSVPPTPATMESMFHAPPRSTIRSQVLAAASSMGMDGWTDQPSLPAQRNFRVAMSPQFDTGASHTPYDHSIWLAHGSFVRESLLELNKLQGELWQVETQLAEHEREQDVRDVLSQTGMDELARDTKEWCQHLSALMSSDTTTPVEQRQPRPPISAGQSTKAPTYVHPSLRAALQPPASNFIHVEPALQASLREGVESMCRDVRQWKTARSKDAHENQSAQHVTTPPEALAWTNTLAAQQKPLESVLQSVITNWSRLQRVADGLHHAHSATQQLHERERAVERRIEELKQEERLLKKVDRGQFNQTASAF